MATENSDPKKSPVQLLNDWQNLFSEFKFLVLEQENLSPIELREFFKKMDILEIDVHTLFRTAFLSSTQIEVKALEQEDIDEAEDLGGEGILDQQDNQFGSLLETIRPHPDPSTNGLKNPINK